MYFTDEIYLVTEKRQQDKLKQFETIREEASVWCDITSVTGTEASYAGQNGHKAEARVLIHMEDFSGQKIVRYEGGIILKKGYYEVYRTYQKGDVIELYLVERAGVN